MGYFAISNLFVLVLVGLTNGHPCSGPNGKPVCLEPHCIQTTADVLSVMDLGADPCQDFYQYACGNYGKVTKVPSGKSRWTPFKQTQRRNREIVHKLLEEDGYDYRGVRSEALVKAKTFFKTCINQTFEVEKGIVPFLQLIDFLGGWSFLNNSSVSPPLITRMSKIFKLGIQLLFGMSIGPDEKNPSVNVVSFQQFGLMLYRPSFYAEDGPSVWVDAFIEECVTVMSLLHHGDLEVTGRDEIEAEVRSRVNDVVEFEKEMSKLYIPSSKLHDSLAAYNKMTLQKLADKIPDFDLLGYVTEVFGRDIGSDREVVVFTPSYFRKLNHLLRDTPARVLEDYSMLSVTRRFLKYLTKPYRDAELEYVKAVVGTSERPALLDQCLGEVDRAFGMVTGALFVGEKSSEEAKQKTVDILSYIKNTLFEYLPRVSWMDAKARSLTEGKIRAMTDKIGFPDFILDPVELDEYYEGYDVSSDSALSNDNNYKRLSFENALNDLDVPVDKSKWDLTPSRVAAEYDRTRNAMTFPSGILQPPFFSTDMPTSMVFGAIGMVMAHELTHGFDTQGRHYDKDGLLRSWLWGETAYKEKTDCLIRQYSQYLVDGQNVNGESTLDENIADIGGLKISYLAYKKWRKNNADEFSLPLNMTPSQEFFLGLGQVWCSIYTPGAARAGLQTDSHSPEKYRVIGMVSNLPEFSEAFQCAVGTPMNPAEKCEVW